MLLAPKKKYTVFALFTKVVTEYPKYIEFPNVSVSCFSNASPIHCFSKSRVTLDEYIKDRKNRFSIVTDRLEAKCYLGIYFAKLVEIKDVAKRVLRIEGHLSEEESKSRF
mmetsp:Transcript_39800/g.35527  ORF Transcript_39800/g.35527 Transcript_39800/m.35527 type:complete len:110 (+) Transcript_39800:343-672(+)